MSYYWYQGFLIEEGLEPLHEHIHYWHHTATPFGGGQMIAFHITAKAMRIAFQKLIEKNILTFPITEKQLESLSDADDVRVLSRAFRFRSTMDEIKESNGERVTIKQPKTSLRTKSTYHKPILLISKHHGFELNSKDVSEFHALVVERLAGNSDTLPDPKMSKIFEFIHSLMPQDTETLTVLAYLCSWAFITPYKRVTKLRWGEHSPAWRFVLGLQDIMLDREYFRKFHRDYTEFATTLSKLHGWIDPETIVSSHYDELIEFARTQSLRETDSKRSRRTFEMIAAIMSQGQNIHRERPDALALPHLHKPYLLDKLPALAKMEGGKLVCRTNMVWEWYYPYLSNLSMVWQAFSSTEIKCVYRDLRIQSQCKELSAAGFDERRCYVAPHPVKGTYHKCRYLELWQNFFNG